MCPPQCSRQALQVSVHVEVIHSEQEQLLPNTVFSICWNQKMAQGIVTVLGEHGPVWNVKGKAASLQADPTIEMIRTDRDDIARKQVCCFPLEDHFQSSAKQRVS